MRQAWTRAPLRMRLVALFSALLLVAIIAVGLLALTLLRQSLVEELDAELESAAQSLVWESYGPLSPSTNITQDNPLLPAEYAVIIATADGTVLIQNVQSETTPVVGSLALDAVEGRGGIPVTTRSVEGPTRWRVIVRPLTDARGQIEGTAAVALPLTSVDQVMHRMVWGLVAVGAGVLALAGGATYAVVRRSLRPLRRIETTAAKIAAGDLTQRVDDLPTTTEVGSLAASLNTMLTDLETSFEAQRRSEERMTRFVGDASHELRTPLATVRGYAELYRMGGIPSGNVPEVMDRIEDSATRMSNLVTDLLSLARLDQQPAGEPVDVDITAALVAAASDLRALDPTRSVEVLAPTRCQVRAEPTALGQILTNLIGNVAAYTPPGSPVELVATADSAASGPRLVVEVRDHGPGVPEADRTRIFERFARLDAGRSRDAGGSGLGLSIAHTAARALGGTLECLATHGGGATMRLTLPLSGPPTASPSSPSPRGPEVTSEG